MLDNAPFRLLSLLCPSSPRLRRHVSYLVFKLPCFAEKQDLFICHFSPFAVQGLQFVAISFWGMKRRDTGRPVDFTYRGNRFSDRYRFRGVDEDKIFFRTWKRRSASAINVATAWDCIFKHHHFLLLAIHISSTVGHNWDALPVATEMCRYMFVARTTSM